VNSVVEARGKEKVDMCPLCVQVIDQIIENLLNIILSGPVIGSCNMLCDMATDELKGKLPESVIQVLDVGCKIVCDYVGVTEFMKLVEAADLNSIWLCQQTKMCTINDCDAEICAKFSEFRAIPAKGPIGSTFLLTAALHVFNQTGTGEFVFGVDPSGGFPLGHTELVSDGWKPGVYNLNWEVTISNEGGDPDQPPFLPGMYKVGVAACEGKCGSQHSHTRTIATIFGSFNVTGGALN